MVSKIYHAKKFSFFLSLPFNSGLKDFEKEFNPYGGRDVFDMLMTLNSYLIFGLSLFLIFNSNLAVWSDFFRLIFVITLFFLIKNFFALFIGWLFDKNIEIAHSQNANLIYRSWFSIWIFPVLIGTTFIPNFTWIGQKLLIGMIMIAYVTALIISIIRIWDAIEGKYYKIFYLCALEIMPLIFLVYWLKSH